MGTVSTNLAPKDGGHNKFLEFITAWLDITAPRYFWQQMATYRIGSSWLSKSTMYTLTKGELEQKNFENPINPTVLYVLNECINAKDLERAKDHFPESFLQRRIMVTN